MAHHQPHDDKCSAFDITDLGQGVGFRDAAWVSTSSARASAIHHAYKSGSHSLQLTDSAAAAANEEEALARTLHRLLDSYMATKCKLFGIVEHKLLQARQDASRAESGMHPSGINRSLQLTELIEILACLLREMDATRAADDLRHVKNYESDRLNSITALLDRTRDLADRMLHMVRGSISESSVAANLTRAQDSSQSLHSIAGESGSGGQMLNALIHSQHLAQAAEHSHAAADAMILAHRPAAKISEQATIADSVMHARKSAVEGGMPAKELEKAETALRHAAEFAKIGLRAKGIEQKVLQAIYAKSGIRFAMKEVASSLALQQHYSTAPEAIASKACQSAASSAREVRHQAEAADMHARDALHALDKYNAIATQKRVESQEGLGGTYCGELYGQSFSVDFDESGRATVSVLGQEAGAD
ncbi:hypothetical protein FOZ60_011271 [Perkinsus olseni]|uniref:Uncharacterized protein n=2 Tax=Perkinsus olseni TaxID=32597 RepID=A0A7J6PAU2_PEROL|nr:hypothetical protein FOZ60_011271 [Perkinsus olseni]